MRETGGALDLQKHMANMGVDSRIKAGRDDALRIMQAENRRIESRMESSFEALRSDIRRLDEKIDGAIRRLDEKVDGVASMKKWVVGMFVTILLALAAILAPGVAAFLG